MSAAPHLLHVFSTFNLGGPQMRAAQLLGAFGGRYRHSIVSVSAGELDARARLDKSLLVEFPSFPDLKGGNLLSRLMSIKRRISEIDPDLVLTYNWGAIEVVMCERLFRLAPLVHHEDGFGPDEVSRQIPRRKWFRRFALAGARKLIVPSRVLERTATQTWWQSSRNVCFVPNAVDIGLYDKAAAPITLPGLDRSLGGLWVGTVAGLRPEKNLTRLVRVFARVAKTLDVQLIIVGVGPEKDRIVHEAQLHGVANRVHLPGFLPEPHRYVGLFDVFALSSDTEQFPLSLVEAMAARLPAVCTAVGDIPSIVSPENTRFIVERENEDAFAAALLALLTDRNLRASIGDANRSKVELEFTLPRMIDAYDRLYRSAMTC